MKMPDVAAVVTAAEEAGRAILEVRARVEAGGREHLDVRQKKDGPVTAADLAANEVLHRRLQALYPEIGWLSEETGDSYERLKRDRVWVVDPLDGTQEFIAGSAQYGVSVGLVERGEPILGVLHFPSRGETCWALRGAGAWRKDGDGAVRLKVSPRARRLRLAVRFADVKRDWLRALTGGADPVQVRLIGSTVAKMLHVAKGESEAFPAVSVAPFEWDVCAGHLLVAEAGGHVTDLEGRPLRYNRDDPRTDRVLVSNGVCHDDLLGRLRQALATV